MKRILSIIFVTVLILTSLGVQASANIADFVQFRDRREWNGKWYDALTFSEDVSWEDANEYCRQQGGHLLIVDTEEEQIILENMYSRFNSHDKYFFWIGAHCDADGQWKWVNGKPLDFANWDIGEPADKQEYAAMYSQKATKGGFDKEKTWKWFASANEGDSVHTADKFGLIMEKEVYKEISVRNPDYVNGKSGEVVSIESIQKRVNGFYLTPYSDYYADNQEKNVTIQFENTKKTSATSCTGTPIKSVNETDCNLEFQIPAGLASGSYKTTIYLNPTKDKPDLLPLRLVINNLIVGDVQTDFEYFEYRLPDAVCNQGTPLVVTNIQGRIPVEFRSALAAAASNGLQPKAKISFSGLGGTYAYETNESPVLRITESTGEGTGRVYYNLVIPYFAQMNDGSYKVELDIYVPENTNPAIKPLKFVIGKYILNKRSIPHTHEWGAGTVTKAPTCTESGERTYTCACGETKKEEVASSGHSYSDWYVKVAPTSTEKGLKVQTCSGCGDEQQLEIDALGYKNTKFTVTDTTTLGAIGGATVFVQNVDGSLKLKDMTDVDGVAEFDLANGVYSVQIIANGYEMRNFVIEKKDGEAEFTPYLSKSSILQVSTNVTEMDYEDIIAAGIDVNAVENKHIYKCITVLQFSPVGDDTGVQLPLITINLDYVCDDAGTIIKANPVKTEGGAIIYPVSKDIYLIIQSQVTWLKEMFDVQLIAANTSSVETITDCVAKLDLPEGLSIAVMNEGLQTLTAKFDDIAPGTSKDVHWYICGDKEGEYFLNGRVSGTREGGGIVEKIKANFSTQEPISVLAGSAMKFKIEAERSAVVGKPYRVKYTLQNVSHKTLNNVEIEVPGGKFCKAYDVKSVIHQALMGTLSDLSGTFNNGYKLADAEFRPGEILSGVFEIEFGRGVDTEQYIRYMVTDMFTLTGHGSTTEIPTEIVLVDKVIGHSWNEGVIVLAPTCTAVGEMLHNCADCSETMRTEIPATGHSYDDWETIIESSCKHSGRQKRVCEICGMKSYKETGESEHNWDNGNVSADGNSYIYTCKNCGVTESSDLPETLLSGILEGGMIEWKLFENGLLLINGSTAIPAFESAAKAPWSAQADKIRYVRLVDGIQGIGNYVLGGLENVEEIVIPRTVKEIGDFAFDGSNRYLKVKYGGKRHQWENLVDVFGPSGNIPKEKNVYYKIPTIDILDGNIIVYAPDKDCMLIITEFEGAKMVSKKVVPVESTVSKTLEELGVDIQNTDKVKVYLWENAHTISPLCPEQSVQITQP